MKLHIISISQKVPTWVSQAFLEYQKRFTKEMPCLLTEIPLSKRTKTSSTAQLIVQEGLMIKDKVLKGGKTIALDREGELWSTAKLAQHIHHWTQETSSVNFLIGGPEGLSKDCLEKADHRWSLSPLTFPHTIVRILLIEQLYRALCILRGHPYHRE